VTDVSLESKVALVTGAARRVGAAIARRLHEAGASIVIHYRGAEADATQLEKELNAKRAGSAVKVKGDLLAPVAPQALVSAALQRFARLDFLVNNASAFYPTPLGEIEAGHWEELIGSNLRAPLFLAQAAAPQLALAAGAIVNIADLHAERPL
jgi:pteridine reductase